MEHNRLNLEIDRNLINRTLDDINMRYVVLYLYIIRNDLFHDLMDDQIVDSYQRILILDDIYKGNLLSFWEENFIEIAIDLGLIKNIRSIREFQQKDEDFIIRLGEETVTIEGNTISVPADTLFAMIRKKFKFLTRRNFNDTLTRLKSVRCEQTGVIHPFIYPIGEKDYTIADDLYYILDQFGNPYQAIKIETTIEGFYQRFNEIYTKLDDFLEIYDPVLNNKSTIIKIDLALEENKELIEYLKEEGVNLSEKFTLKGIDRQNENFQNWYSVLMELVQFRYQMKRIEKELDAIRKFYSGKNRKNHYLEFIEKVSFNENNIVNNIQDSLISLRQKIVEIKEKMFDLSKKKVKLLNLDFERYKIMNE
ncbi:MAG: hypothetical protein P8Y70_18770 [Candidatus Lokiarchaeota archaeon]